MLRASSHRALRGPVPRRDTEQQYPHEGDAQRAVPEAAHRLVLLEGPARREGRGVEEQRQTRRGLGQNVQDEDDEIDFPGFRPVPTRPG